MRNFIRTLSYAKDYALFAALNILFNILSIIFSLISIVMIIPFLELLFDKRSAIPERPEFSFKIDSIIDLFYYHMGTLIETEGKETTLIYFCVFVVVVFLLKNLFRYGAQYFMAPVRNGVVKNIRSEMYNKMLFLPLSYFSKQRKGDLISRLNADVKEIEHTIMSTLEVTFKEPITIIIFIGAMLVMSAKLTLFVLFMLLITIFIVGQIGKSLKRQSSKGQQSIGTLTSLLEETLGGIRIIKAFGAEKEMSDRFRTENNRYYSIMNKIMRRKDLSSPLSEFLAIIIVSIVLWYGGNLVLDTNNSLEAETFIGFMVIFSQLIPPAKGFASAYYNIQKGLAASERIYEILDAKSKITEIENPKTIEQFKDKIEFENVSFAYYNYDDKKVLEDINLTIKKGQMIALVGQSGAGKSTLADLLPRFYDPVEGKLKIDGIDTKQYAFADLRNLLGVVTQESILFNDTVYNNIILGTKNQSQAAVEKAAIAANAHDFIINLPEGYNTTIGDRGSKLSGGERQRLTIARAILKNPDILILDEATSSLDSESEKLVQDALIKLMKNRTSIVIAHRLSTIQYADEIVVLEKGKIIERGNHIGLTAKNGVYKKLVDHQAF